MTAIPLGVGRFQRCRNRLLHGLVENEPLPTDLDERKRAELVGGVLRRDGRKHHPQQRLRGTSDDGGGVEGLPGDRIMDVAEVQTGQLLDKRLRGGFLEAQVRPFDDRGRGES